MLEWRKLADLPAFTRSAALVGSTLYAIGPNKRDTVAVDLESGAVERLPAPKHHNMGATLAALGDQCLLIGSKGNVMVYDPAQHSWQSAGKLREQMVRTSTAASGGALYLFGGRQHPGLAARALRSIERFDLDTGTAVAAGTLPRPLSDCLVAARNDGTIDVLGGDYVDSGVRVGPAPETVMADWFTFDPSSGVTAEHGTAPRPLTRGGAVWACGILYLLGGDDERVASYDPATGRWQEERPLPAPGAYADAFVRGTTIVAVQGNAVSVAELSPGPATTTVAPAPATEGAEAFVVRVQGDAGPYPTREEAERMALEFLRAGLTAEIRRSES